MGDRRFQTRAETTTRRATSKMKVQAGEWLARMCDECFWDTEFGVMHKREELSSVATAADITTSSEDAVWRRPRSPKETPSP